MAEIDRRSRAILNSLQAARDERAAKAQEERQFMTSFNPNTAKREDFTRFRENIKRQAIEAAGPSQGGIFSSQQGKAIDKLYHEPYRKMMGMFLKTNPEKYAENFPIAYQAQKLIPNIVKAGIGAASGIPMLGQMLPKQTNELLGDLSYLDYRPNRLMNLPEGFSFDDGNQELLSLIESIDPYEANYRQFFPMQVPDYFYQFMDNEMLPYIMGMR